HVRVATAPLAVPELPGTVRPTISASRFSSRSRQLFASFKRENFGVTGELRIKAVLVKGDRVNGRVADERVIGGTGNPAIQGELRGTDFARGLRGQIFELGKRLAGREDVCGGAVASAISGVRSCDFEAHCFELLEHGAVRGFGVVTIEPRERAIAPELDQGLYLLRFRETDRLPGLGGAGAQLRRAGDLLHDADAAHRHEVPLHTEALGTVDGQILEPDLRDRIRPFACGDA